MYDRGGFPRYAVNILHVASRHVGDADDAAFAAGFDLVANRVLQFTGVAIGFTLDLLPSAHSYKIGDDQGWVPWFELPDNIRIPQGSQISQTGDPSSTRPMISSGCNGCSVFFELPWPLCFRRGFSLAPLAESSA